MLRRVARRDPSLVRRRPRRRAAGRPPGRAAATRAATSATSPPDRRRLRAGREDPRARRAAAERLGDRRHDRVRRARADRPGARRPGRRRRRSTRSRPGSAAARSPGTTSSTTPSAPSPTASCSPRYGGSCGLRRSATWLDAAPSTDPASWRTRSPSCSPASRSTAPTCPEGDRAPRRRRSRRPARRRPDLAAALDALAPGARRPGRARRAALPADQRHGDGQGRRGLRVLPLLAAHLAQRGRRRPGVVRASSVDDFHAAMAERQRDWPHAMTTLSTHDTKRSEDVRARIAVLAELPERLGRPRSTGCSRWRRCPTPASGRCSGRRSSAPGRRRRERLHAYAEKAMREAGDHTTWTDPDAALRGRGARRGRRRLRRRRGTRGASTACVAAVDEPGRSNALAAKLLALTMPGVPDVYQGTELWDHSLVDPDNRRPVDFDDRASRCSARRRATPSCRVTAAALRAAARPARAVHVVRPRAGRRARPPTTCSPSTAAARSPSRPGCRSGWPQRGGWGDTVARARRARGATC